MHEHKTIGNYAIDKFIGYGASSAVFKGYDLKCRAHGVSKNVAIKFIWSREMALDEVRRLEQTQPVFEICDLITYDEINGAQARELIGDVIAQLEKAINSVIPVADDKKIGVLVLKLINGEHLIDRTIYHDEKLDPEDEWTVDFEHPEHGEKITLKEWLTPVTRSLDLEQRLEILLQLARAIDESHRHGVVHGDLNPWNVFFDPKTGRISIIDLGRNNFGVQGWRTPEHYRLMSEEIDSLPPETDIRLLGQWMRCLLPKKGPWNSFIERCYAEDPNRRPSAKDVYKALKSYLQPAPKRRLLAVAALFSITALMAVYAWKQRTPFSLDQSAANRIAVLPYEGSATGKLVAEMVMDSLDATNNLETVQFAKARDVAVDFKVGSRAKADVLRRASQTLGAEFLLVGAIEETDTSALSWEGVLYQRDGTRRRLSAVGANTLILADNIVATCLKVLGSAEIPLPASDFYSTDLNANFLYSYGNEFLYEGNINAALPMYRKALEHDPDFQWARAKMAFCLYKKGDLEQSETLLLELVDDPAVEGMPQLLASSYGYLAYISRYKFDFDQAVEFLDAAKEICERHELSESMAHLYTLESFIKGNINQLGEAERAAQIAGDIYRRTDDQIGLIKNLIFELSAAENRRDLDLASDKLEEALEIARTYGLQNQEAWLLQKDARLDFYQPVSEIGPKTLQKLLDAKQIQDSIGNARQSLYTDLYIAEYYQIRNEIDKAMAMARAVHQRAKDIGVSDVEISVALLISDLAMVQNNLELAELYLTPLLEDRGPQSVDTQRYAYSRVWKISAERGLYDQAEVQLKRNLALCEQANHERHTSYAYNNLGELFEMQGKYDLALQNYEISLEMKRGFQDIKGLTWTLRNLVMVSIKQNNFVRAERHMAELQQLDPEEFQTRIVYSRLLYEKGLYAQAFETIATCKEDALETGRWTAKLDGLYELYTKAFQLKKAVRLPVQFGN